MIIPNHSFSEDDNLPIEDRIRLILRTGNPIEYPSQYIIVEYDSHINNNILAIEEVKNLIATDADSKRLFSSQFRDDLIVHSEKYSSIFEEYLSVYFKKENIKKGIITFRTLCNLKIADNYDEEVNLIYHGLSNRTKFRHHYQLPPEERSEPYALMITYDRHAPYPNAWAGYFFDVVETFCYLMSPKQGYSENLIESTNIYEQIKKLPRNVKTIDIFNAVEENKKFTQPCNELFSRPGGYKTPFLFFILRDKFRDSESFAKQSELINRMKEQNLDAFDTASIFVGGFFGYEKFYDDYYTILNLPIFKSKQAFPQYLIRKETAATSVDSTNFIERTSEEVQTFEASDNKELHSIKQACHQECDIHESKEPESTFEVTENIAEESTTPATTLEENDNTQRQLIDDDLGGTILYKQLYSIFDKSKEIRSGLGKYKDNDVELKEIVDLMKSSLDSKEKQKAIKNKLNLKKFPAQIIKKIVESGMLP